MRRERRWTPPGETPAWELVRSTAAPIFQQPRLFTTTIFFLEGLRLQLGRMPRRFRIQLVVLVLVACGTASMSELRYRNSLKYSCLKSPFIAVVACSTRHDGFPDVELSLTDPRGRNAGKGAHGNRIPRSRYGRMVEIPKSPDMSKAVAVEVCDAVPGRYIFTVTEHGSAEYHIDVKGYDGKGGNLQHMLNRRNYGDRTCQFRFRFLMAENEVKIDWLDEADQPFFDTPRPVCNPVPRA